MIFIYTTSKSQSVIPDRNFGKNGIVIADLGFPVSYNTSAQKVFVQPDISPVKAIRKHCFSM